MQVTHFNIELILGYQAENKLAAKHVVEEAMTEAFVRKCNNCNRAFVKEDGCNKMKCMCGNLQCYVCSSNVADYSHFGSGMMCSLYGNMQEVLKEQVAVAEERTVRELLKTRAGLKDDDVRVDKRVDTNIYNRINLETPRPPIPIQAPLRRNLWNPEVFLPCGVPPILNGVERVRRPLVHRCIECDRIFGSADSLSQHRSAKHNNGGNMAPAGPTRCITCHKSFHSPDSLSQHRRDKHGPGAHGSKRKRRGSVTSSPQKKRRV